MMKQILFEIVDVIYILIYITHHILHIMGAAL